MKPAKRTKNVHTDRGKWDELIHGIIGSNQYLAYRIRHALNPIEIFGVSTYSEEEFQWAIELLAKAYADYDLEFLQAQADGLKKLKEFNPTVSPNNPTWFLYRAYNFLRRRNEGKPPFRIQTIELTERLWVITRLTQNIPELPLPNYDEAFERKIQMGVDSLPTQKWSRQIKKLGLVFTPAKRGPKAGKRRAKL